MENGADIGDGIGEEFEGGFHFRVDVVDDFASPFLSVVDAQGKMGVVEITPIIGDNDILYIRIRQMGALIVVGAVVPTYINAIVIFRFLFFLPCGER